MAEIGERVGLSPAEEADMSESSQAAVWDPKVS
jgi:hypothetical protein